MKKVMLSFLVIMLFIGGKTFAQESGKMEKTKKQLTQDERTDRNLKHLTATLTLTTDEQPKVREVISTSIKQEDADKAAAGSDAAKYKQLSDARMKTKREGLKQILTPDQFKKLEEMWKGDKEKEKSEMAK